MTAVASRGRYRRRGFNHLSTIRSTLQNVGGAGALANELIQNADDAAGARHLTFRFTPQALEVIDDGGFESCGDLEADVCLWEARRRKKRRCDFHAFQELAGASNRAALAAAAEMLGDELEALAGRLAAAPFWRLIRDAFQSHGRRRRGTGDAMAVFWHEIHRALPDAKVMWTASERWAAVGETVQPSRGHPPETVALLEALGIPTVSPDIQRVVGDLGRAVPTATLNAARLLAACEASGLATSRLATRDLPAGLQDRRRRSALRRLLAGLAAPDPDALKPRIRKLALWRERSRGYANLESSWLVERDTAEVFGELISAPMIDAEVQRNQAPYAQPLLDMGDVWDAEQAVELLEDDDLQWPANPAEATGVIAWLGARLSALDADQIERLGGIALVPTTRGLLPATQSVIPGGFADPLEVAGEVSAEVASVHTPLLERLGVAPLSFGEYVRRFVPDALENGLTVAQLERLLDVFVDHRRAIDGDDELEKILKTIAWVPCRDGYRRRPRDTYFDTEAVRVVLGAEATLVTAAVVDGSGAADLLAHLGTRTVPQPQDVISRIRVMTANPPTDETADVVIAILRFPQEERADVSSGGPLRRAAQGLVAAPRRGSLGDPRDALSHSRTPAVRHDGQLHRVPCEGPRGSAADPR